MDFVDGMILAKLMSAGRDQSIRQINITLNMARNKLKFDEFEEALILYQQALSMAQLGSPDLEATILCSMGNVYIEMGKIDSALRAYELGFDSSRKRNNHPDQAQLLNMLGVTYYDYLDKKDEAINYFCYASDEIGVKPRLN